MKIRHLKQMDYVFLIVITAFAFDLGNLKYALAFLFTAVYFLAGWNRPHVSCRNASGRSFFVILCGLAVLFLITIALQLKNGFCAYAVKEAIFFLTPLMLTWLYSNHTDKERLTELMDVIFLIYALSFLASSFYKLTLENILRISFVDSYSPFEGDLAFLFFVLECYYLSRGEKRKALLALFLCFLCFKRLCLLAALFLFFTAPWYRQRKRVSHKTVLFLTAMFVLLPIVTCALLEDPFERWFYSQFGVSLDELTLSRTLRIEIVKDSQEIKYGLGSVTTYITEELNQMYGFNRVNRSLHNDLVRIYLECGIVGSIFFTYGYLKACSFCRPLFILMVYIFLECYVNHLFGAGTAGLWTVIYLFLIFLRTEQREGQIRKKATGTSGERRHD